jgi:hypothetical protein
VKCCCCCCSAAGDGSGYGGHGRKKAHYCIHLGSGHCCYCTGGDVVVGGGGVDCGYCGGIVGGDGLRPHGCLHAVVHPLYEFLLSSTLA